MREEFNEFSYNMGLSFMEARDSIIYYARNPNWLTKLYLITLVTVTSLMSFATSSYAAENFFTTAASILSELIGWIAGLSTLGAVLALTIAFMWAMWSPSQAGSRVPYSWITRIFITWIAINSIGSFGVVISELTANSGYEAII